MKKVLLVIALVWLVILAFMEVYYGGRTSIIARTDLVSGFYIVGSLYTGVVGVWSTVLVLLA